MPKKSARTILVCGATGRQGGAAMRKLQERGFAVRALTRDPANPKARTLVGHGTEVTRGDMKDKAALVRALDGVHGVFSVQNWEQEGVESEVQQGTNVVDTARGSRINHFVYSSVCGADRKTGIPHFESKFRIEEHLRGSGLHYTIFRPVFMMENWLGMRERIEQGVLALPFNPDTRLQMVAVDDIGAFTALSLEKPGNWQGRAVELAGDEMSMTDLAGAFSRMTGREVRYEQTPWEEVEKAAGPEMTKMYRWMQDVGFGVDISALRQEYPNLTGFERWLQTKWSRYATA